MQKDTVNFIRLHRSEFVLDYSVVLKYVNYIATLKTQSFLGNECNGSSSRQTGKIGLKSTSDLTITGM